jgi:hypothetical protein
MSLVTALDKIMKVLYSIKPNPRENYVVPLGLGGSCGGFRSNFNLSFTSLNLVPYLEKTNSLQVSVTQLLICVMQLLILIV